jgi:hypothetical protein
MKFRTSDVLSVSTGTLLPHAENTEALDNGAALAGLYGVLNHMTGDNLMTHQLLLAQPIMKPFLVAEHPWIDDVVVPETRELPVLKEWLAAIEAEHGKELEITAHPEAWGQHDPIEDLYTIKPDANVIVVEMSEGGSE